MKDILIVEDGCHERERLERLFQDAGYTVVACESVGEAEKRLQSERFRLAILDIGLGDRSGSYLFSELRRNGLVDEIVIFTGNPSVHLKQRFRNEGAADYIVKASPQAHDDYFLQRVREIVGHPHEESHCGLELGTFLREYVSEKSRQLFLDVDDSYPPCSKCGTRVYLVTFSHQTQMPPEVSGLVVCGTCGTPMDPEIK